MPDFAKPVVVAEPKRGDAMITIAAREKVGRLSANRIIVGIVGWYEGVRRDYAGETP